MGVAIGTTWSELPLPHPPSPDAVLRSQGDRRRTCQLRWCRSQADGTADWTD